MSEVLNRPFSVINNESNDTKNKFLNGVPYQNNFPGNFPGTDITQQENYKINQDNAIGNYNNISQYPLGDQSNQYQYFNSGQAGCENYLGEENIESFTDENLTNPCNQSGFGKITPEFVKFPENSGSMLKNNATDNPLLDTFNRPISEFSHNNMVPYYGSKITQNMRGTGVPQAGSNNSHDEKDGFAGESPFRQKLADFTGCDEAYQHKRESGPRFSAAEGITNWVFGMPNLEPDRDRYSDSVWRRNGEKPVESIQVGPGIGLGYENPGEGGFQQYTRIMPNNVGAYKMNQLENRINAGKFHINNPTSQIIAGVTQNKPDLTITQARRPTMKTKFYGNAPSGDNSRITDHNISASRGKQSRSEANFGLDNLNINGVENFNGGSNSCVSFGEAPVGMTMGSNVPQQSQDRDMYKDVRETFKRGKDGCFDDPQGSNEWGLNMGMASGIARAGEQRSGYYVNLTDRGDMNNHVLNASGMTNGGQRWGPNSFQDPIKTTTRETTEYSYQGNVGAIGGTGAHKENTWGDQQKTTRKETTEFSYQGNVGAKEGIGAHKENTWTDQAKTTRKQTTAFSHNGNLAGNSNFTNRFMFEGGEIEHFDDSVPDIESARKQIPDVNKNKQKFRSGGMSSNNVRSSGNVFDHFPTPGRQNLIPSAHQEKEGISSIGLVQYNGLGSSESGPGTFINTNIQISGRQAELPNEGNFGKTISNNNRDSYVDYRQTDPFLIENLRTNPLSIYSVGNAKNAKIPQFFVDSKPSDFGTYVSDNPSSLNNDQIEQIIDGNPNLNKLNFESNAFLGVGHAPNTNPFKYNKGYGGNDNNDATHQLNKTVGSVWKGNHFDEGTCKNNSIAFASPGYNSVSHQINSGISNEWGPRTNLPYGPRYHTGNPQTQLGGVWDGSNNYQNEKAFNYDMYFNTPVPEQKNQYVDGLPGSLIAK